MFRLADRTARVDASGIRRIFDLARSMPDPINLSIGLPDFDMAPELKDAAISALRSGRNRYTPTQGIPELVAASREQERAATGRAWTDEELIITSGVSGGLFLALLALVQEGDEVLIPDPFFVMYKHLVRLFGGTPVYIDTYASGFDLDPAAVARAITPRTRLLLLNSPANPTGRIVPRATLQELARVCGKAGIPVVSDEIYRAFAYQPFTSMAEMYEHTLVLCGHSKTYGMTGWRLGYAAGPKPLIQAMAKLQQYSFVCAPSVAQYAALACPTVDLGPNLAAYRAKRDLMTGLLSRHFEVAPADGAFYLWLRAPGDDGDGFAERAIASNVLIIPGSVFSERRSHVRLCYTVDDQRLRRGAEILCRLAG